MVTKSQQKENLFPAILQLLPLLLLIGVTYSPDWICKRNIVMVIGIVIYSAVFTTTWGDYSNLAWLFPRLSVGFLGLAVMLAVLAYERAWGVQWTHVYAACFVAFVYSLEAGIVRLLMRSKKEEDDGKTQSRFQVL